MTALSNRERNLAIAFYAATSLATLIWWTFLFASPQSKAWFFGVEFGNSWFWLFLAPDVISALVMSTLMIRLLLRSSKWAVALAWLHVGAQGYAWAICIGLAVRDPSAYWGVIAMTISTGVSLAYAIRLLGQNILWGAFQFQPATPDSKRGFWRKALQQTGVMWGIFLVLIPTFIAIGESALGWDRMWPFGGWRLIVGSVVFIIGSIVGLLSGWAMTQFGEGTPLPARCTRKLVVNGPYARIRNPMALTGIGQGIAVGLIIGSPLVMVYALLGGVWWEVLIRPVEESHLSELFGSEYDRYAARVPCWRIALNKYQVSLEDVAT